MSKVNNKDTRAMPLLLFSVFIANFEHISHLVLVFLIVNFEHVIIDCDECTIIEPFPTHCLFLSKHTKISFLKQPP